MNIDKRMFNKLKKYFIDSIIVESNHFDCKE